MKKLVFYILMIGLGCISCYEDESNKEIQMVKPIIVDMGGMPSEFVVYQFGYLHVVPVIYKEGLGDENLFFEWRLKGFGANRVLSTAMVLDALIYEEQQADPYTLILTVTDTLTRIKEIRSWELSVTSQLSTGLMVADTEEGETGDLSLITAFNFSNLNDDKQDTIYRHIYSLGNGERIAGQIVSMQNTNYETERATTVLSERNLILIDPASYIKKAENQDFFFLAVEHEMKPMEMKFYGNDAAEYLLESGLLYYRYIRLGAQKFGYPYSMEDAGEYAISDFAFFASNASWEYNGVAYDSLNSRFLGLPDNIPYGNLSRLKSDGTAYDPGNVGNKRCLHLGTGKDGKIQAVLQDRETGACFIYGMKAILKEKKVEVMKVIDLSKCLRIREAKSFCFSPSEDVMYYTVGNEIYAALLTSEQPESFLRFDTELVEDQITSLRMWTGAGRIYYTPGEDGKDRVMNAASRMLVITTWNGVEGKVITLPIETLGAGLITKDRKYHKVYRGFDRITAIAPQNK